MGGRIGCRDRGARDRAQSTQVVENRPWGRACLAAGIGSCAARRQAPAHSPGADLLTTASGLENYHPDDSRETRMLGRFPRRNHFISEYIFRKTGKQVGSRIQQLRESNAGEKLLNLLSPTRKTGPSAASTSRQIEEPSYKPSFSHTVVAIEILPPGSPGQAYDQSPWASVGDVIYSADHPRPLESINPTVAFISPSLIMSYSQFRVYSEGLIIHAETAPLELETDGGPQTSGFLYHTTLIPKYWHRILDSPDPTRYTISQEVLKEDDSSLLFAATFKFCYPYYKSAIRVSPCYEHTGPYLPCD
ncbi:hypothetical protein C8R47DRAFT_1073571 [Mycena vitilis]|nr:hypothetical protein C8R47DRAFT_1084662 [Mycena vitilis]KAJ6482275.1 hypothetical protein C8R47DRAFT_1073571 [Mycena vitilis]